MVLCIGYVSHIRILCMGYGKGYFFPYPIYGIRIRYLGYVSYVWDTYSMHGFSVSHSWFTVSYTWNKYPSMDSSPGLYSDRYNAEHETFSLKEHTSNN